MLQAVFSIPAKNRGIIAPLFPCTNGLMRACLDGSMGQAFGDHPLRPGAALLCIGDFACLGGDPKRQASRHIAGKLALRPGKEWNIPCAQGWEEHIAYWRPKRMERGVRFAVEQKSAFDVSRLCLLIKDIPPGFSLHAIDEALYGKAMAEMWSRDFCSQFHDAADYARRGLGTVALYRGELVSGASSYVVHEGGIEIQTDTREDMRRRGLAAACCARLILDCIKKGIEPTWDAANNASLALAEKLGYSFKASYDIWEVSF